MRHEIRNATNVRKTGRLEADSAINHRIGIVGVGEIIFD